MRLILFIAFAKIMNSLFNHYSTSQQIGLS